MTSPLRPHACRLPALIGLVLSAVLLSGLPARAEAAGRMGLTPSQEQTVLRLIDTACGDTWCEGDYAFRFQRFSCDWDEPRCSLALLIAPYSAEPLRWHRRSAELTGLRRYGQLVKMSPGGLPSLQPAFLAALTSLISDIEATVTSAATMGAPVSGGRLLRRPG